ncbi:type II toxin-antitoxin system VapB family antitoxin [Aquabacter sp. P-9]|uniref:type II toxin-antitoxin system VapB family antitoxin n=1 Tax=Aquabacter sediminis TaxID=3029197 RepID=UPI00237D816E|nr:type II toxin-antitoxin system VapB family antitoxin [Aquabacter sp. P-9]MDE1568914.1 type II toxin-antitoxin system VapB family antitoxin [Aquabacter sp. P-9]
MARQLNIRSDEAVETAKRLAKRHGLTTTEVVVQALRRLERADQSSADQPSAYQMTSDQVAHFNALLRLSEESARQARPGATSDHRDMYDDNGLPI